MNAKSVEVIPVSFIENRINTYKEYLYRHDGYKGYEYLTEDIKIRLRYLENILKEWRAETDETD